MPTADHKGFTDNFVGVEGFLADSVGEVLRVPLGVLANGAVI